MSRGGRQPRASAPDFRIGAECPGATALAAERQQHRGAQRPERQEMTGALSLRMAGEGAAAGAADPLTPRELEIVRLVARALRNKEIGRQLAITEGTVKIHLHNIYQKLGVGGRIMLILYAQAEHLL
jgi:DNA-binding NarL/FixJ family response regulator